MIPTSLRAKILKVWTIVMTIAFYFAGLQMVLMSDSIIIFFIAYMLAGLVYFALRKLSKGVMSNNIHAKGIFGLLIILHVLPLINQIFGLLPPTIDTIFAGTIGLALLLAW